MNSPNISEKSRRSFCERSPCFIQSRGVGALVRERERSALNAPQRPERKKRDFFSSNLSNWGNVFRPVLLPPRFIIHVTKKLFLFRSLGVWKKEVYLEKIKEVFCDFFDSLLFVCVWLFFVVLSWLSIIEFLIETVLLPPINNSWWRIEVRTSYNKKFLCSYCFCKLSKHLGTSLTR